MPSMSDPLRGNVNQLTQPFMFPTPPANKDEVMSDDHPSKSPKTGLRIVHSKNDYPVNEFYYPLECYTEDFELDNIETLNILKEFKPKVIEN